MTKAVRIENADTSSFKLIVEVWERDSAGGPDRLAETLHLGHPTALVTAHVHSHRYLVIKENPSS